jgi:type IV pilus assembly protein PilV
LITVGCAALSLTLSLTHVPLKTMIDMYSSTKSRGFTLIEVLITIVILSVGLLGLATLQTTTLNNQLESNQRAQALFLVEDMANRIRANAIAAKAGVASGFGEYAEGDDYGLTTPVGSCTNAGTYDTVAKRDICEWELALAGSGVTLGGDDLGSILGARGCIEHIPGSTDGETIIRVTIAWQGLSETRAPASNCGLDQYGDDKLRRTATLDTVLANLIL